MNRIPLILIVPVFVLCSPISLLQAKDPCSCNDKKGAGHYRFKEKHQTDFNSFAVAAAPVTPADMVAWQKLYREVTKTIKAKPLDQPRRPLCPEDSIYTLNGYMWYVKHESSGADYDCDFHIEIGPASKAGKRVIVEVTNDNCKLQQEILDTLQSHGYSLKKEFDHGIPCTVAGLGFYDGVHPPSGHGRKGKTTFTSWELHPVKTISFR